MSNLPVSPMTTELIRTLGSHIGGKVAALDVLVRYAPVEILAAAREVRDAPHPDMLAAFVGALKRMREAAGVVTIGTIRASVCGNCGAVFEACRDAWYCIGPEAERTWRHCCSLETKDA